MQKGNLNQLILSDKIKGEVQINMFRIIFLILSALLLFIMKSNPDSRITITDKVDYGLIVIGIIYSSGFIYLLKKKKYYVFLTFVSSVFDILLTTISILFGVYAFKGSTVTLPIGFNVFLLFVAIVITIRRHNYLNTLFTTLLAFISYIIVILLMYKSNAFYVLLQNETKDLRILFDLANEISKAVIIIFLGLICSYISYNFDITFYKGIEYEIEKERNKITLKITSSLIHDIKNSLNVILGYVELMRLRPEKIEKYEIKIVNEINNLYYSLQEILDYIREKKDFKFNIEKVSLKYFLLELRALLSVLKSKYKNCKFEFNNFISEEDFYLNIDLFKIKRALLNIIKNALDATITKENPEIGINIVQKKEKTNNKIELQVQDNGIGIDKSDLSLIFNPYYTKNKSKGTGLGLSITKSIIEEHKGSIKVDSEKGSGTSFYISLPAFKNSNENNK